MFTGLRADGLVCGGASEGDQWVELLGVESEELIMAQMAVAIAVVTLPGCRGEEDNEGSGRREGKGTAPPTAPSSQIVRLAHKPNPNPNPNPTPN